MNKEAIKAFLECELKTKKQIAEMLGYDVAEYTKGTQAVIDYITDLETKLEETLLTASRLVNENAGLLKRISTARGEVEHWKEELEKERVWANSMIDNLRDDIRELQKAKQEVAEQMFGEIHKEIELALDSNYKARNNNGYGEFGEYVNGKIHALRGIEDFLAEIEKKYEVKDNA